MAEFVYNPIQVVAPGEPILFDNAISCNKGYVLHQNQSGNVILTSKNGNPCFARYQATFNGNIAVPTGGTVGPIAVAIAVNGEPVPTSRAIVTPAAVENYFNVTSTAIIDVPKCCCFNVSVENVLADATLTPESINVQNANFVITRIA